MSHKKMGFPPSVLRVGINPSAEFLGGGSLVIHARGLGEVAIISNSQNLWTSVVQGGIIPPTDYITLLLVYDLLQFGTSDCSFEFKSTILLRILRPESDEAMHHNPHWVIASITGAGETVYLTWGAVFEGGIPQLKCAMLQATGVGLIQSSRFRPASELVDSASRRTLCSGIRVGEICWWKWRLVDGLEDMLHRALVARDCSEYEFLQEGCGSAQVIADVAMMATFRGSGVRRAYQIWMTLLFDTSPTHGLLLDALRTRIQMVGYPIVVVGDVESMLIVPAMGMEELRRCGETHRAGVWFAESVDGGRAYTSAYTQLFESKAWVGEFLLVGDWIRRIGVYEDSFADEWLYSNYT